MKYFAQRPDYEQQRADREIHTRDGVYHFSQDQKLLEQKIDEQEPDHLYRIIMSSGDTQMNQQQTEEWAKQTLESQGIHNYMLVAHAGAQGHTDHPHVHVLIPTNELLNRQQLNSLRDAAETQYKIQQSQIQERQKLVNLPDEASQGMKQTNGGKGTEIESEKPERRRQTDYQLGR
ncbi:relaxase/mobilization nuclease domain-containing protein [Deinococcus fonticola]|uniref:relaxase/mobilization nuclease domain-containing protein n=1 Tax=Deinococcus fonticola TaxID=2528713 RepID=UPI001431AB55|nr:relaxase/mobilization nuclease domain-containing protein [Deinococcus fonticola]